ncbi:MAG: hypothetical protein PHY45_00565 [Rhodocyclaceae bacterium]|nr:hypothetical protein [Rhodocyclaceae bacterium]
MKSKTLGTWWAGALCAVLLGCSVLGIGITHIGDIVANPSRFDGSEVRVKGKVVDVNKLPLLDLKLYTLRDDTGEITVVAGDSLPALNSVAVVRAKVETSAIIQGQALGLRLTEIEKSAF